ncbi:hypothetical protein [Salinisphaera shabanensis]|uniref:hypothetical protein n=1 Tax=Salinisphaera shabanensis TaxID=180542 RepID=UPI00333F44B8
MPKWLIRLTGKPDRDAFFGYSKDLENSTFEARTYAFDQFTFPACLACNQRYSQLETDAKNYLTNVIDAKAIKSEELSTLLDWFDKVRVGLWLGMRVLDKNSADVEPNFHIEKRMGQFDRLLIVEKSDIAHQALNFGGTDTFSFAITPSAFFLRVNNYYFTNISYMFLCSRRLGFPFPRTTKLMPDSDKIEVDLSEGRERLMTPILRKKICEQGPCVFQQMYPPAGLTEGGRTAYESSYVAEHSLDQARGAGNIFLQEAGRVIEHSIGDFVSLEPSQTQPENKLRVFSAINVLEWQNWLSDKLPSIERLSKAQRHYVRHKNGTAKRINQLFINYYRGML